MLVGVLLVTGLTGTAAADTTVRVTGDTVDESGGWWFQRDPNNQTSAEFNFDEARIGSGSLYVAPIGPNPSDKFIAELFSFQPIDPATSFSFDFLLGDEGAPPGDFYINVYTNLPGTSVTNFYECRFDFVATSGSTTEWTTLTTVGTPTAVMARGSGVTCPASLAEMPDGSTVRAFAINVGQNNGSDEGTSGYLDNVVVAIDGTTTTYDFEVPLVVKDACKDGGYAAYGFDNQGACVSSLQADEKAGK